MRKLLAVIVIAVACLLSKPSQAQQLLESYQAFLSERDNFNSNGQRLTNAAENGGPLRSSKRSSAGALVTGSHSSTTEPSIHAVSTSGRPGCAALAM